MIQTYTVKEASEILGIKQRAVQTRCKKEDVRKKDNKYLITDEIIDAWKESNAMANAKQTQNATQLKAENESLKKELTELRKFKANILRSQIPNAKDELFHINIEKEFNI